jgi:hypothetical protein
VPSNSLWLAVDTKTETMMWNDALTVAAKKYPRAIKTGVFPNNGDQPTLRAKVDNARTRNFFDMEFTGFEKQVTSVLDHFLELKGMPIT